MGGWEGGMLFDGIVGTFPSMLYDPRVANYTVPTRGGEGYPGRRGDRTP